MDTCPKLRPVKMSRATWQGREVLVLEDPLGVGQSRVLIGVGLAPLLALCDGTRDLSGLRAGFLLRTGVPLFPHDVESLVNKLDAALLLENERSRAAIRTAEEAYRAAPCRPAALAGGVYPGEPDALTAALDGYARQAGPAPAAASGEVVGLISPHIDYQRGWKTYARVWQAAASAVELADLVVIFGTDHVGTPGALTLTRQSYSTPWGTLPTDVELVDKLALILGEERAFSDEMHHRHEHSIELAAVWLHHTARRKPRRLLPLLCGSHDELLGADRENAGGIGRALDRLSELIDGRRTLVVAAGDLSHVGPAFGDAAPLDPAARARLRAADAAWLDAACGGGWRALTEHIVANGDPTRVCGAAPIHHMLRLVQGARGSVLDYEHCPADTAGGSIVSIAGAIFTR